MGKVFLFSLLFLSSSGYSQQQNISDSRIYKTMDQHARKLLEKSKAYAVAVGIVTDGKTYTKHYGELDKGKGNTPDNNTYFEIASVTKLLTGILMAKAVLEDSIRLEDDIRKYLDGPYPNLAYQKSPVKIKDLLSFKSAFDRTLPDDSEIRKSVTDSTPFYLRQLDAAYDREKFLAALKMVRIDTVPGIIYRYNNLNLELSAFILERVYHSSFETLLQKHILNDLHMNATKMQVNTTDVLANGYNGNHLLMPHSINHLWGAAGYLKSTMTDLVKLLSFELQTENRTVQETQRNISNSSQNWNGYFWDGIEIVDNGKFCHKQGGAYGTQTFFAVFPEQHTGICIVVNINHQDTYEHLFNTVVAIAASLKQDPRAAASVYGYRLTNDKVVFSYRHSAGLDAALIRTLSVAGSFNNWNVDDLSYQMHANGRGLFEVAVPKSYFEKGKVYQFKFVINKVGWTMPPLNAANADQTEDRNLILRIH